MFFPNDWAWNVSLSNDYDCGFFTRDVYFRQFGGFHDAAFDWISGTPKRYKKWETVWATETSARQVWRKKDRLEMCWNINTIINENTHPNCVWQMVCFCFQAKRQNKCSSRWSHIKAFIKFKLFEQFRAYQQIRERISAWHTLEAILKSML